MDINLMADIIEWRFDDYTHFKKCGEITASPDEKCFGLNCAFCKTICTELNAFMQHVREKHSQELWALYFSADDDVGQEMIDDDDAIIGNNKSDNLGYINDFLLSNIESQQQLQKQLLIEMEVQNKTDMKTENLLDQNIDFSFTTIAPVVATNEMTITKTPYPVSLVSTKTPQYLSALPSPAPSSPATSNSEEIPDIHFKMKQDVVQIALRLAELDSNNSIEPMSADDCNNNTNVKYSNYKKLKKKFYAAEHAYFEPSKQNTPILPEEETLSQHSSSQEFTSVTTGFDSKHEKRVLSYILKIYKNFELLWNPNHPDYAYNYKKPVYGEISSKLYKDLNYKMTGDEIYNEIKRLRNQYRRDLEIFQKRKGFYIPRLWCFYEMDFLREATEMGRHKPIDENISEDCDKLSESNDEKEIKNILSGKITSKIIEMYKEHECLWFVDHPDFRSKAYRKEALNKMLENINSNLRLNFTLEDLEKFLKNLRSKFSLEKRDHITAEKLTGKKLHVPNFEFYTELATFLMDNVGPFHCTTCDLIINTSDQHKIHKASHDGSSPFICSICKKGFGSTGNLSIHLRRHRGDYPFECKECGKRVATSTELFIHMRSHTGERPYFCDLCGKSFKSWSFFNIHKRMHQNEPSFVCSVCDRGFYEKCKFMNHMNAHLDIRNMSCNICEKTFTSSNNLRTHMELHDVMKKYKCTICNRAYAQMSGLRSHMILSHSVVKVPSLRSSKKQLL